MCCGTGEVERKKADSTVVGEVQPDSWSAVSCYLHIGGGHLANHIGSPKFNNTTGTGKKKYRMWVGIQEVCPGPNHNEGPGSGKSQKKAGKASVQTDSILG